MQKNTKKFRFMTFCAFISLAAILLPWMSYGVGSKTGLDLGGIPIIVMTVAGFFLLIFSYISYKLDSLEKSEKTILYICCLASFTLLTLYSFEIARIAYQTHVAKNLPMEMFGVPTLAAKEIRIGYGLWLGEGSSFIASLISFIALKMFKTTSTTTLK